MRYEFSTTLERSVMRLIACLDFFQPLYMLSREGPSGSSLQLEELSSLTNVTTLPLNGGSGKEKTTFCIPNDHIISNALPGFAFLPVNMPSSSFPTLSLLTLLNSASWTSLEVAAANKSAASSNSHRTANRIARSNLDKIIHFVYEYRYVISGNSKHFEK